MSNWVLNQSSRRVVQVGLNFIGNIRNDELIHMLDAHDVIPRNEMHFYAEITAFE